MTTATTRHWLTRFDPDDGEPFGELCDCEIGEDHTAADLDDEDDLEEVERQRDAALTAIEQHAATLEHATATLAKLDRLRELHAPSKIYTECGHDHTDDDFEDSKCVDVEEVGYVCEDGVLYEICESCCLGGGDYQTEDCVEGHGHGKDVPRCPTTAILDEATS